MAEVGPPSRGLTDAPAAALTTDAMLPERKSANWVTSTLIGVIVLLAGILAWGFFGSRPTEIAPIASEPSETQTIPSAAQSEAAARLAEIDRLEDAEREAKAKQERLAQLKVEEEARLAELQAAENARLEAEAQAKRLSEERARQEQALLAKLKAEEEQRRAEIKRLEEATQKAAEESARLTALQAEEEAKLAELKRLDEERQKAEAVQMEEERRLREEQERLAKAKAEVEAARAAAQVAEAARIAEEKRLAEEREAELEAARIAEEVLAAEELAEKQRVDQEKAARAQAEAQNAKSKLLTEGYEHIESLRLTSPAGNNALHSFQRVLESDPDNPEAKAGIAAIVDKYLSLTEEAAAKRDYQRALQYLDRAEVVVPGQDRVAAARLDVEEQHRQSVQASEAETVAIDAAPEVSEPSPAEAGVVATTASQLEMAIAETTAPSAPEIVSVGVIRVSSNAQDAHWPRNIAKIVLETVAEQTG